MLVDGPIGSYVGSALRNKIGVLRSFGPFRSDYRVNIDLSGIMIVKTVRVES
jgi:hypothetical protein